MKPKATCREMFENRFDAVAEASETGGRTQSEAMVGHVDQVIHPCAYISYQACRVAQQLQRAHNHACSHSSFNEVHIQ